MVGALPNCESDTCWIGVSFGVLKPIETGVAVIRDGRALEAIALRFPRLMASSSPLIRYQVLCRVLSQRRMDMWLP